jgi:hypothetical protein
MKGIYKGDIAKALDACVSTARIRRYEGIGEYMDKGYIPAERSGIAVSTTLEYTRVLSNSFGFGGSNCSLILGSL